MTDVSDWPVVQLIKRCFGRQLCGCLASGRLARHRRPIDGSRRMQNDMISSRGSNKRTDPLLSSASVDCVKDERVASFFWRQEIRGEGQQRATPPPPAGGNRKPVRLMRSSAHISSHQRRDCFTLAAERGEEATDWTQTERASRRLCPAPENRLRSDGKCCHHRINNSDPFLLPCPCQPPAMHPER